MGKLIPVLLSLLMGIGASAHAFEDLDPAEILRLEPKLRIGVYSLSEKNRLILIGLDNVDLLNTHWSIDAEAAGFFPIGKSIKNLDPRFLISVRSGGIHSIHAFSTGNLGPPDYTTEPVFEDGKSLPDTILKAENIRNQLLVAKPPSFFRRIVGSTAGNFAGLFNTIFRSGTERRHLSAGTYLSQIVEAHLMKGTFPDLQSAFSKFELEELGALLAIRFHKKGYFGGALATPDERRNLYQKLIRLQADESSKGMDYLIGRANEEGLVAHPISKHHVMLYYDLSRPLADDHWSGFRLDLGDSKIIKSIDEYKMKSDGLIPLGVFGIGPKYANRKILNFDNPEHSREKSLLRLASGIAGNLQGIFVPFAFPLNLAISLGKDLVTFTMNQSGSPLFADRIDDFAILLMVLETGLVDFKYESQQFEVYSKNIEQVVEEPLDRESLLNRLVSGNRQEANEAVRELMIRNVYFQSGTKGGDGGWGQNDKTQGYRFRSWTRLANLLSDPKKTAELDTKLTGQAIKESTKRSKVVKPINIANPQPADSQIHGVDPTAVRPVILFLVDGLRPDIFRTAAEAGKMPNSKRHFIDKGIELRSFTPVANSIPSWSTILSGFDPDTHGNRGTTSASRNTKINIQNFIDFRTFTKGTLLKFFGKPSIQYQRLEETLADRPIPTKWFFDQLPKDQILKSMLPINDGKFLPFSGIANKFPESGLKNLSFGTFSPSNAFDLGVAYEIAKSIKEKPGQYRLVTALFGSIDDGMHAHQSSTELSLTVIDKAIGEILDAAGQDPILKDAVVMIVSDHGGIGGNEGADPGRPFLQYPYELDNSRFNLLKFFAGDYPGVSKDFDFVVGSHKPADPQLYYSPVTSLLRPENYTYRGVAKRQGRPGYHDNRTLIVEPYGDRQGNVYFLENADADPATRISYYHLSNYLTSETKVKLNIPETLLSYRVTNTEGLGRQYFDGTDMHQHIAEVNGLRPVGHLAMALHDAPAVRDSICKITSFCDFERDPVLLMAYPNRAALILTKGDGDETRFAYFVMSNFSQLETGELLGSLSLDPDDDPLDYSDFSVKLPLAWLSDREILSLTKDTWFPTAIFNVVKNLTISPSMKNSKFFNRMQAETPDMILYAAFGFHFNPHQMHQADHGGLTRYEVQQTLFVFDGSIGTPRAATSPVLARDLVPTVLDYLGKHDAEKILEGRSFRSQVH